MKFQTVYRTNADYIESWKKLRLNPRIERVYESRKGHLVFKFGNTNLRVELVEATGTLIIYYRNEGEKESYFPLLKEVLATKDVLRWKSSLYMQMSLGFPIRNLRNLKLLGAIGKPHILKRAVIPGFGA